MSALLVFLGGGLGAVLRHGVNLAFARGLGAGYPWGTLAVNVAGSAAMGWLAAFLAQRAGEDWTEGARLFLATGLLGGFTTFSAFSLDTISLWERGEAAAAAAYVAGSVVLGLLGLGAGVALGRVST